MATLSSGNIARAGFESTERRLPPLEQGDRLGRAEYLRRYASMPPRVKAERIEGVVHMAAAALSSQFHGQPHAALVWWLFTYSASTPGVVLSDNGSILLDIDNDPQPDAFLRILPTHGGRTTLTPEGYVQGAPELIVEVAASSASIDLGAKMRAYCRNGVSEYVVFRAYDRELDWFALRDASYERLLPDDQQVYRSEVFPGLWLNADALIAGRFAEVLSCAQAGLASADHSAFAQALAARYAQGLTPPKS